MDIYRLLPSELQTKVKYFVLQHPIAEIIKDEIERLRCDETTHLEINRIRYSVKSMVAASSLMNSLGDILEIKK